MREFLNQNLLISSKHSPSHLSTIIRASGFPDDVICAPRYAWPHVPGMDQATLQRSIMTPFGNAKGNAIGT